MSGKSFLNNRAQKRVALTLVCLLGLAVLFVAVSPSSSTATIKPAQTSSKRTRPEFAPGEILVRYRDERVAGLKTRTATLMVKGRQAQIQVERFGGSNIVPGLRKARVAPEDTLAAIEALKKQPDVLYAEPNYILKLDLNPNDPRFTNNDLYGMLKIGAPTAWNTTTGSSSIVVGVIDEGIDKTHPDLAANIWTNPVDNTTNGVDDDTNGFVDDVNGFNFAAGNGTIPGEGHATHVAGTIGGVGNNATGVVGVNWNVKLMSLRFIDGGSGFTSDAIDACNYAKMMRDLWVSSLQTKGANIRVLNNSYGGGGFSQAFLDSINVLNQTGILFVAAAGNVDLGTEEANNELAPHYPSGYEAPNVVAAAATDQTDTLWSDSHFGNLSVDLGAPGVSIVSTTPGNTYSFFSGTSMATPHVAGAAALLWAQNSGLSVEKVKNLLLLNGDVQPSLVDKTLTGRRLNVGTSFATLLENDTTAPGQVVNFHLSSQNGRDLAIAWNASGDDGPSGQASLYQITFTDSITGAVTLLKSAIPASPGSPQNVNVTLPYRHRSGTVTLREFDNAGNEGTPATFNASVSFAAGDPYATAYSVPAPLSTGGTALNLIGDDKLLLNRPLGLSFPFFGQNFTTVNVSTNGNLFFSAPPTRPNGDADDVPSSSVDLAKSKAISGMWDDIRTDRRAGDDVFVVSPDSSRVIFRWSAVTFGDGTPSTEFPVNFEIELRTDGTIISRYGTGQSAPINTNLFPVVGIAGGEPDAYVIASHTSETASTNLTNALTVNYLPRGAVNPLGNSNFFVSQHYQDFLNRVPDASGLGFWTDQLNSCGADPACIELKRINVSGAFYLSIEFQETGYLVERMYKVAYGDATGTSTLDGVHPLSVPIVRRSEFVPDSSQISSGVIVGQPGWEAVLENNKVAFANDFVGRTRFTTAYPGGMPPSQFVDTLNANGGNPLSQAQRDQLVNELTGGTKTRAQVVRAVAEDSDLFNAEKNKAFVLMQYLGYLQRDPNSGQDTDYTGYDFWLRKLNEFNGNFVAAEMVKAFIVSGEYKGRFGPAAGFP